MNSQTLKMVKLLFMFLVAFSLASLPGPVSHMVKLPWLELARAQNDLCSSGPGPGQVFPCPWVAAGPAEDTLTTTIFTDEAAEFTDIQSASPHIDMTDWPLTPDLIGTFTTNPNFRITSTISEASYFEIQFLLANNFWGCDFSFGNAACGIQIRQGIAHMVDTAKFAANEPSIAGQAAALDTPVPGNNIGSLPTANPCLWDTMFPDSGPNCTVGAPGGTAYHLAASAGANGNSAMQAPGSKDLNAAAAHFVAAGVATGCDNGIGVASCTLSTDSRLSGISATVASHTVNFSIRYDSPPRLHLGQAYAAQICWLFTGSYTIPCLPYLSIFRAPGDFPGFTTSTTNVNLSWGIYTAAYNNPTGPLPFDSSLYFRYDSRFVSGVPSIQPPNGPCSAAAVPTVSATDYMYLCNPTYDSLTNQMEFAPGFSTAGDPAVGQTFSRYAASPGTGVEAVVNSTAADTTYTGQAVLYGPTPTSGAALHAGNFFWSCAPGATLTGNTCTSGTVNTQATLVFAPAGSTTFDGVADKVLYGSMVPQGSPLAANTVKFVDTVGSGVFEPGSFTALSAGVQAEDQFGQNAYTLPVFEPTAQFGYLNNGWDRVMDNTGAGLPNYFTWLSAWNPSPVQPGTIRQGFKQTTSSVNPFVDNSLWNEWTVGNIYDSLNVPNPDEGGQLVDWMAVSEQQVPNPSLTYTPPAGTTSTFRFILRSDLFFQDGRKVTSFDVAFSYLALKATGAYIGGGAAPMAGVTILSQNQFDINVNAFGPFTLYTLTALPVLPGAYWTRAGVSAWNTGVNACTAIGATCYPAQYTLSSPSGPVACAISCASFPATMMNVNPAQTSASYDPIANHTFVGSGPWQCGTVTSSGSGICTTSGTQNPPVGGSYNLTRFGKGLAPASSVSNIYFRSSGNLALWLWSQDNGNITHDFLNYSAVASCYGQPVTSTQPCAHFQQGIGANGGPIPVGLSQLAIVLRFVGVNWIAPFNWASSPPLGILPLNPVLYENTLILNPAGLVGCTTPYPTGGYDC